MMLVHRTVFVTSALVRQVSSHRTLEKALATFTGELAVMFPTTFVSADNTFNVVMIFFRFVPRILG